MSRAVRAPRLEAREDEFQATVIDYAMLRGWMVHHQRPARTKDGWKSAIIGHAGWPDLVLARERGGVGRLVIAELKKKGAYPSPKQRLWLGVLERVPGIEVFVWRPADWPQIQVVLR